MSGNSPKIEIPNLKGAKAAIISAHYVPGSFELPFAAKLALENGADFAVVLGVVLRGETPHFDYVCKGVTDGLMQVSLQLNKPIGFGVLTVDNIEQAIARSGIPGSKEDKGFDSAVAALELFRLKRQLGGRFAQ